MPATGNVNQTLQSMRSIISNLRQSEINNANMAQQLSAQEAQNASLLNSNNAAALAQKESQAANVLTQFANAERNAAHQLEQLDRMLVDLQNQLI